MDILLLELKEEFGITWNYEDSKLERYIDQGIAYLNRVASTMLEFEEPSNKELLFDYCRYARSQKIHFFEVDNISRLLELSIRSNVAYE